MMQSMKIYWVTLKFLRSKIKKNVNTWKELQYANEQGYFKKKRKKNIKKKKKKKISRPPGWVFFSNPLDRKTFFFFHVSLRCSIFKHARRARKLITNANFGHVLLIFVGLMWYGLHVPSLMSLMIKLPNQNLNSWIATTSKGLNFTPDK